MVANVILVEATPRNPADGSLVTVRLAGAGAAVPYRYGALQWRAGIAGMPKSQASLDFDGEQLGGSGVAQALALDWAPSSRQALADVAGLYWTDAAITVRVGPEGDAMPPAVMAGLVLETGVEGGTLKIALADLAADLKRPVLVDRFAGTGGIEGPVEFKDLIKSRAWGRCFNVPGRQIDAASNIWCFGDPRRPWQAFVQVRTQGVAPNAADMTVLLWQGSAEATFAALRAAAVIAGGGVLCPSIACVKWWTPPADLHADIRGEQQDGYVETAPEIAARIVAARSTLAFAPGAVAKAAASRPAACGWRIDTDSATAAEQISDLLGGVSLSWLLIDGTIRFRAWEWSPPARVARSHAVTRQRPIKPVGSRKLGYRRNYSPMARGDLAAIVLATDVVYEDGSPVEAWKPATPGATAGAPVGTTIGGLIQIDGSILGGRPAQDVVDDLDINAASIIAQALRQDDLAAITDARTFVSGQSVATYVLQFRNEQTTLNSAINSRFELLGARTADGTGWVLNLATVQIGSGKTLAQKFDEIGATNGALTVSVQQLMEAVINPDGSGFAKFVLRANANGSIVGITGTADGSQGRLSFVADEFEFVDPNGGNPIQPFYIADGVVHATNFEADTITYGALVRRFSEGDRQQLDPMGGYQEVPGGLIMQWGRYRQLIRDEVAFSIVFPLAFPNACFMMVPVANINVANNERDLWLQTVGEPTRFGATVFTQAARSAAQNISGFDWIAFGK